MHNNVFPKGLLNNCIPKRIPGFEKRSSNSVPPRIDLSTCTNWPNSMNANRADQFTIKIWRGYTSRLNDFHIRGAGRDRVARVGKCTHCSCMCAANWQSSSEITNIVDFTLAIRVYIYICICICVQCSSTSGKRARLSVSELDFSTLASFNRKFYRSHAFCWLIEWRSALEKSIFPCFFPCFRTV